MYFSIVLAHDGNVLRRYENDMSSEVCNEAGMALECSARRADGAGRYVRLDECGLAVEVDWHGGNGLRRRVRSSKVSPAGQYPPS